MYSVGNNHLGSGKNLPATLTCFYAYLIVTYFRATIVKLKPCKKNILRNLSTRIEYPGVYFVSVSLPDTVILSTFPIKISKG